MSKHNDDMFKKVVTGGLERQHRQGVSQGAYAMCKVINDLAHKAGKTAEERLESIITFCSVCIDPNKAQEVLAAPVEDAPHEV